MSQSTLFVIVLLITTLPMGLGRAEDSANALIGSWRLVSYKAEYSDGVVADLYGASPLGIISYDASGHMFVHVMKADLPKCGTIDRRKCPDKQARMAFDNAFAYWGRYEVSSSEKTVVHYVQGASWPDFVGMSQERFFEVSGKRLTITTPRRTINGVENVGVLVWERME